MSAYLDASVLLPSQIEEPFSAAVDAFIAGERELLVSDFAVAEFTSALSRLLRTGQRREDDAFGILADFETWRTARTVAVEVHPADVRLATTFVRRFDLMLRVPDALHLAMTRRLGATLVTLDRRLARAALALGFTVEQPA
ncbi:MAG TPA: type II toxin-antitoxin system VapC family toxin [Stellaceae bacterium]